MNEKIKFLNGAFCPACQAVVLDTQTVLSDDDTLSAIKRGEDVQLLHHPRFPGGTTADHSFSLTLDEKERLGRQLEEHMARVR
jgi:hypothetical protein